MAKVSVRVSDAKLNAEIVAALSASGKRHVVVAEAPVGPLDNPRAIARGLVESGTTAVILDYIQDDAASVKLLQSTNDLARATHFIFIMPEELELSHVLMAVNEGASAMIKRPVNMASLINYVERAISGPGRFRGEFANSDASSEDNVADLEKNIRTLRQQNSARQKLISYLLATSAAEQSRKVLLVSDSGYQRALFKKKLEDHFFRVFSADNAKDGLEMALAEKPLIVVSDLEMDGQNGIEFCRSLKIDHKFIPCYFIICTANQEKLDSIMVPGNGVDDGVLKPGNESDYSEFITRVAQGLLLEGASTIYGSTRALAR